MSSKKKLKAKIEQLERRLAEEINANIAVGGCAGIHQDHLLAIVGEKQTIIEQLEQHIENLEQVGKENELALSNIVKVLVENVGLDWVKLIITECEENHTHFNLPPGDHLMPYSDMPHPLDPPHKVCANCGLPKLAPFDGLCINCSSNTYE